MSAESPYQLEPELRFGIPRPARVRASARAELKTIALIGCLVACIIVWFAARDLSDLYRLRTGGVTELAVITDTRKVHSKSDSYYISYSLPANGIRIEDEDQVSQTIYEQKSRGDKMPVTYLPGQPQTHRLGLCWEQASTDAQYCLGAGHSRRVRAVRFGLRLHVV